MPTAIVAFSLDLPLLVLRLDVAGGTAAHTLDVADRACRAVCRAEGIGGERAGGFTYLESEGAVVGGVWGAGEEGLAAARAVIARAGWEIDEGDDEASEDASDGEGASGGTNGEK